jgi:hypothetical protein
MSQQILNHYSKLSCDHLLSQWREVFGSGGVLEWCGTGMGIIGDLRLPPPGSDGFELVRQTFSFEEFRVFSVPLGTLSPVPLALAGLLSTGHLTIFEPGMRTKPASANAARTFAAGHGLLHRCLSAFSG